MRSNDPTAAAPRLDWVRLIGLDPAEVEALIESAGSTGSVTFVEWMAYGERIQARHRGAAASVAALIERASDINNPIA